MKDWFYQKQKIFKIIFYSLFYCQTAVTTNNPLWPTLKRKKKDFVFLFPLIFILDEVVRNVIQVWSSINRCDQCIFELIQSTFHSFPTKGKTDVSFCFHCHYAVKNFFLFYQEIQNKRKKKQCKKWLLIISLMYIWVA